MRERDRRDRPYMDAGAGRNPTRRDKSDCPSSLSSARVSPFGSPHPDHRVSLCRLMTQRVAEYTGIAIKAGRVTKSADQETPGMKASFPARRCRSPAVGDALARGWDYS